MSIGLDTPSLPASCRILVGDAIDQLRTVPDRSVHCCVTSPPYWGLRDYGIAGQIGLEHTPAAFVAKMVRVFAEVWRVLRDDGNLWVNLGDSYYTDGGHSDRACNDRRGGCNIGNRPEHAYREFRARGRAKDLVGIPWRVAFALQDAGWYLREDIIWHKRNPMPESVRDRCTRAHEYLFHLTKRPQYYYDIEAIKEPVSGTAHSRGSGINPKACGFNSRIHCDRDPEHQSAGRIRAKQNRSFSAAVRGLVDRRNKRSVWSLASAPYRGAHFATFPPALVEPCILAGSPAGGTVLDPFGGSGTTAAVALRLGRSAVLIELNPKYIPLIEGRVQSAEVRA